MAVGYARVSIADQDLSGQKDQLLQHGAIRVFEDVISDKTFNRPGRLDARVGLSLIETGSERSGTHREDERFLMNSTLKTPICGAVLARRDAGELSLTDTLRVKQQDILSYAPITRKDECLPLREYVLSAIAPAGTDSASSRWCNLFSGWMLSRFTGRRFLPGP